MLEELIKNALVWNAKTEGYHKECTQKSLPFGIPAIDKELPLNGLPYGHIHEWALEDDFEKQRKNFWRAPLFLISTFLRETTNINSKRKKVCWIGRRCWPSPAALNAVFHNSEYEWNRDYLFVNAAKRERRLWATIEALRCKSIAMVVADGSGLKMNESKRLQVAVQNSANIAFIMRPVRELSMPSIAYSKWIVRPVPSDNNRPRWHLQRLRCRAKPQDFSCYVELNEDFFLETVEDKTNIQVNENDNIRLYS